jgi:parvulin-like peptidyl-prolyl isomerase
MAKQLVTLVLVCLVVALATGCTTAENAAPDDGPTNADVASTDAGAAGEEEALQGGEADDAEAEEAEGAATEGESSDADSAAPAEQGDLVATVNGEGITLADFQSQVFTTQRFYVDQGVDPNTEDGQRQLLFVRRQVLADMINQVLIEQEAAALGVSATDDEVAERLAGYVEQFGSEEKLEESLAETGTTRTEIEAMERSAIVGQKMLEQITADLPTQGVESVHARHILCSDADDCETALARLQEGEDFADVATEVSIDSSSVERGGDLDWIARGTQPSQRLEEALFSLEPGAVSDVIETEYGFHVIEVLEVDDARELSADQLQTMREKALMDWLAERRAAAEIEIFVEDLADAVEQP